jgi:hypothetical protein
LYLVSGDSAAGVAGSSGGTAVSNMVRMLTDSGEVSSNRLAYCEDPDGVRILKEKCYICVEK